MNDMTTAGAGQLVDTLLEQFDIALSQHQRLLKLDVPAETDFALPAPRPFSFSRGYLSSNARVGSLGQGWSIPGEGSFITLSQTACELHDAQGRVITFSALGAGEERYSQTEQLWIRRGLALQGDRISLSPRWVAVSDRLQQDADDQLEAVTNALGETHRMSHDVMGRRLNHELPDGALWQQHYDRQGRASSLEDPLGGLQQIEYDAAGRPIAQTYTDGSRQEVLYDQAGRITELVLGNGARYRFSYDAMDRVIREENPDGRDQRFEYDAAGQLIARTEMNRLGPDEQPLTTCYTYDANGRLIERHLPETEQAPALCEVFAWRADGHLSRAHNAHSDVLFHYDDAGRLAGEQQRHCVRVAQADAITEHEDWSWQAQHRFTETGAPATSQWGALPECAWLTYGSGHLLGLNVPALGLDLTFEPDALHRETQRQFSVDHQAASQSSLPQSSAPQPLVPHRLVLERGYTATGQVTHLATQGALNGLHQHFDYDALGRMTHRETGAPHTNHAQRIDYTFDEAGRLIGSQHGPQTHHYPMDAAGNRLESFDDGMTASSSHNQIHHLDGVDYRYDGAGNLIERRQPHGERLTMGYDAANRLVHLRRIDTHGQTLEVDYQYDPLGRRTQKIVTEADGTTGTTHYGWDGDHLVHEDLPGPTSTTVIYEPGGFVPMLRIDHDGDDTRTSAYVTDALGTPMQLLDPDGTVRWQAQPDDWAAVHNETGDTRQPIRFQGQWHDEESGLYYNRHRYYDPQQGRYITQDPIGLRGGTNLYGYVGDPTSAIDPLGLQEGPYGLGNGPWGQSNTVRRNSERRVSPSPAPVEEMAPIGNYQPGIGALFPSTISAFAKSPQDRAALTFQGATRSNISLPSASAALVAPMIAPAIPSVANATANGLSALASGANTLSLHAVCGVARVSPRAAAGMMNPTMQGVALDAVEGIYVAGPPPMTRPGIISWGMNETRKLILLE